MAQPLTARRLARSRQASSHCVKLLLLWVASVDGQVDESERAILAQEFPDTRADITTADMLAALEAGDLDCTEHALRQAMKLTAEHRLLLLDLAIGMAAADGEVAIAELHLLYLLADALRLSGKVLEQRFKEATGRRLPEMGDPGSDDWWGAMTQARETGTRVEGRRRPRRSHMTRNEACAILGVHPDSTMVEVSSAYDRLRRRIDPSIAEELGDGALAEANRQRQAIELAYQTLRG